MQVNPVQNLPPHPRNSGNHTRWPHLWQAGTLALLMVAPVMRVAAVTGMAVMVTSKMVSPISVTRIIIRGIIGRIIGISIVIANSLIADSLIAARVDDTASASR